MTAVRYLDRPEQWDRLVDVIRKTNIRAVGLDTETYGQPDGTSAQYRARVQCWSLAVLSEARTPRGYRRASGVVLPREALASGGLQEVLADPAIRKWAHNAPHDGHALRNEGTDVGNLVDSLQWARVALPGLREYGLKPLEVHVLGKPARPDFRDVTRLEYVEVRAKRHRERGCVCGRVPCRARAASDWLDVASAQWRPHERVTWTRFVPERVPAVRQRDVSEMVPGCPGWETWLEYALADAVGVLELVDYLETRSCPLHPSPWTT